MRALDLSNAGGDRASPSPTHLPDPCATTRDLSRHRASAIAGPEPRDHTAGRSTISPLIPYGLTARLFSVLSFIHLMKQCLLITKLIDVLHVHLLGGRQAERRALSPGGRNSRAGFRTPRAGVGSDGKRKKIRTHPSSFLPPDPSAIPTSAASALP